MAAVASKKRKYTSVLNPDNAEAVLNSSINLSALSNALIETPSIAQDPQTFFKALASCVIDPTILPFTAVSFRHLQALGLGFTYDLEFEPRLFDLVKQSSSPANATLQRDALNAVKKHFNVSKESGCRCIIDQYLLAAVVYAQAAIEEDTLLKDRLRAEYMILEPHVAVFTQLQIPHTKITCDDTAFTFYGCLDYGVGFINSKDIPSLGRGSLKLDVSKALTGILEAKSLAEMQDAIPQSQHSQRSSFTGALTNGALWRFFTAHDGGGQIRIYTSPEFTSESDNGVIIELLKDMIVHPVSPMITTDFSKTVTFGKM